MELQSKINHEAPNFPDEQHAELVERDDPCLQKLVLAPLPKPGEENKIKYAPENEKKTDHIKRYLELRFFYDKTPDEAEILRLSAGLKDMMATKSISTRHISWAGLKTADMVRNAMQKWRRLTVKNKGSPLLESPQSPWGPPNDLAQRIAPLHTPPPSDGGTNDAHDGTPQKELVNMESVSIGCIDNMNVEMHVETLASNESTSKSLEGSDYRVRIFIVGIVSMLLECFRRLRPAEAPAMVLLFYCGYAWYMTALHGRDTATAGSTRTSGYFSLIIGGISLFICSRVLFAEHGILR